MLVASEGSEVVGDIDEHDFACAVDEADTSEVARETEVVAAEVAAACCSHLQSIPCIGVGTPGYFFHDPKCSGTF